ncbi:MAG: HNH endonuclease signature motif containing protein [Pseudomonadota bacterium]
MKGSWIPYSTEELAWIKAYSHLPRADAHALFVYLFERFDVTLDGFKALCTRRGWKTGRNGRFPKGHVPANKGKKGRSTPGMRATQFKAGHVPPNRKFIGHERLTREGYVEISVAETNPHTGHGRRYVAKHRWLWEKKNGPVPAGHCLKCKDGNKANTDPSNWLCIPRSMLPRLNGRWNGLPYDEAPAELRPTILAIAELEDAARQARTPSKEAS